MEATTVFLTAEMLAPVSEAITGNLAVVIPVGMGIFGIVAALRVGISTFRSLIHG